MDKKYLTQQLNKYQRDFFFVQFKQALNISVFIGIWVFCFAITPFLFLKVILVIISILNVKLYTKFKHKLSILKCCIRIHKIELGCKKQKTIDQEIRKMFKE